MITAKCLSKLISE